MWCFTRSRTFHNLSPLKNANVLDSGQVRHQRLEGIFSGYWTPPDKRSQGLVSSGSSTLLPSAVPRPANLCSLFQSKDEPEGSEGAAKRVLSFRDLNFIHASSRRGGGNVGIAPHDLRFPMYFPSDFQGLWEGRKTGTIVFRAFHKPSFPRPTVPASGPTRSAATAQRVWLLLVACGARHRCH